MSQIGKIEQSVQLWPQGIQIVQTTVFYGPTSSPVANWHQKLSKTANPSIRFPFTLLFPTLNRYSYLYYSVILLYNTALYSTPLYTTVLYSTVLQYIHTYTERFFSQKPKRLILCLLRPKFHSLKVRNRWRALGDTWTDTVDPQLYPRNPICNIHRNIVRTFSHLNQIFPIEENFIKLIKNLILPGAIH